MSAAFCKPAISRKRCLPFGLRVYRRDYGKLHLRQCRAAHIVSVTRSIAIPESSQARCSILLGNSSVPLRRVPLQARLRACVAFPSASLHAPVASRVSCCFQPFAHSPITGLLKRFQKSSKLPALWLGKSAPGWHPILQTSVLQQPLQVTGSRLLQSIRVQIGSL